MGASPLPAKLFFLVGVRHGDNRVGSWLLSSLLDWNATCGPASTSKGRNATLLTPCQALPLGVSIGRRRQAGCCLVVPGCMWRLFLVGEWAGPQLSLAPTPLYVSDPAFLSRPPV